MKKTLIYGVALAFACVTGLAGLSMAETDKGPAEIHFDSKKPADFPHAKHQEKNKCGDCHHSKGADGKQAAYVEGQKIEKCETCHNATSGMPENLSSFKNVAHENCKGCHKESGKTELNKCTNCHKK